METDSHHQWSCQTCYIATHIQGCDVANTCKVTPAASTTLCSPSVVGHFHRTQTHKSGTLTETNSIGLFVRRPPQSNTEALQSNANLEALERTCHVLAFSSYFKPLLNHAQQSRLVMMLYHMFHIWAT